jgi:hypothetical protein
MPGVFSEKFRSSVYYNSMILNKIEFVFMNSPLKSFILKNFHAPV